MITKRYLSQYIGEIMEEKFLLLNDKNKSNILEFMPSDEIILKIAEYFQNFSDLTRLKIITCLSMSDMCVNDLSVILKINQTTVSHQLKILRAQDIVEFVRDGKIVKYTLKHKVVNDIMLNVVENVC